MPLGSRRGESLVELIVALLLLEIAGTCALAIALSTTRANRHAARGAAEDRARWERYRAAEVAPACAAEAVPSAGALPFPATPDRQAMTTVVRCGP